MPRPFSQEYFFGIIGTRELEEPFFHILLKIKFEKSIRSSSRFSLIFSKITNVIVEKLIIRNSITSVNFVSFKKYEGYSIFPNKTNQLLLNFGYWYDYWKILFRYDQKNNSKFFKKLLIPRFVSFLIEFSCKFNQFIFLNPICRATYGEISIEFIQNEEKSEKFSTFSIGVVLFTRHQAAKINFLKLAMRYFWNFNLHYTSIIDIFFNKIQNFGAFLTLRLFFIPFYGKYSTQHLEKKNIGIKGEKSKLEIFQNFHFLQNRSKSLFKHKLSRICIGLSGFHGKGVFVSNPEKGICVLIPYLGNNIGINKTNFLEPLYQNEGQDLFLFTKNSYCIIDATFKGRNTKLINHCCTPNSCSDRLKHGPSDFIFIISVSAIESFEEINYNYNLGLNESVLQLDRCFCFSLFCKDLIDI